MEITCPCCKKKFEPFFIEDNHEIGKDENGNPIIMEDESCLCPHCHLSSHLSELSDYDQMQVQVEEMKRNSEEYEDESEKEDEEEW